MAGCCLSDQALFLACVLCGAWLSCIATANQDTCGPIRYLNFFARACGLYLQDHTFLNLSIGASKSCETECLYQRDCVAINIGPPINDMRVCELCNSDHIQHPNDLKPREGWTYKGTQNICADKPCLNNAKCFLGYTDKRFLCECQSGYTGELCEKDVDECADNLHDCDANANCTNIPGSYNCVCNPPYHGCGKKCIIKTRGLNASVILGNDSRYLENLACFLEPVINSSVRSRFVRCWHAKEDGWAASTFHGNCDDRGPTVTIIQVGSFIFGGYSDVTWKRTSGDRYCQAGYSSKAFIYSLTNTNGSGNAVYNPVKLRVKSDKYDEAVLKCDLLGPIFGQQDIYINLVQPANSYTYCVLSYPFPPGYSLSGIKCTFYAGSHFFTPTDIEVFYETTT